MKYLTLLKANIKRQKGSFIGVFILIFIITVSLCAVLAVWKNSRTYESEQMERLGYGDITSWVNGREKNQNLEKQIEGMNETEKVEIQDVVFVNYHVNGFDAGGNGIVAEYNPNRYEYYIYNEHFTEKEKNPSLLKSGEVYVAPCFTSLYDVEIGDKVEIEITGENDVYSFTIAGFFEDPFMGSSMTGMKTMLVSEEDIQKLEERIEQAGDKAVSSIGSTFHIFMKEGCELSVSEFQVAMNEQTELNSYAWVTYQKTTMIGFMLILQNIFAGFLLVFVTVLLVVAILVISHSIISSIEQDYADMGILKAVGFTKTDLQFVKTMQYLTAICAGIIVGVPISVPIVKLVNRITVSATGLMIPTNLPVGLCAVVLLAVMLLLVAVTFGKTAKIGKISPVRAIRGGAEDVYFKSRLVTPIGKSGLNLHLALRQLVAGKKQYISACLVTVLLVFFLSIVGKIGAWMGEDGEGLMESFGACPYDIGIKCSEELEQETRKMVSDYAGVKDFYEFKIERAVLNNMDYMMNIISKPEYYYILEGRTCLYDNEMVITEFLAKEQNIKIGDTVTVTLGEESEEFLVTGVNQCANDMGANFSVSMDGYMRFAGAQAAEDYTYYILENPDKQKELSELLVEKYGEKVTLDENTWSGLESIVMAMDAVGILMYVITVIFILVVIVMTGSKILYREQKDLGIYKSLGFESGRLRLMFALRFGIVAVVGSVVGSVLNVWFADGLVEVMLKNCGISKFEAPLSMVATLTPAVAVVTLFMLFAYVAARKIKKIEPGKLITVS